MKLIELPTELLQQNSLRNEAGLTDTLPDWALHQIRCFNHQQWLLKNPDFTFTCKKTNEKVTFNHPDFHFRISLDGTTVEYCLFVPSESGQGFEKLALSLDGNDETILAILT